MLKLKRCFDAENALTPPFPVQLREPDHEGNRPIIPLLLREKQMLAALLKQVGMKEEGDNDDERMLALAGEIKEYIPMINPKSH